MAASTKLTVKHVAGSENIADNTNKIKITLTITTSGESWNASGDTTGGVYIDGTRVASLAGKKFYKNSTTTLYSGTHTIKHKEDGTKTVTVKTSFDTKISAGVVENEKTLVLPVILRSALTVPVFTLGKTGTMTITPALDGMKHEVLYELGTKSGTAVAQTEKTEVTWKPALSLAEEILDDKKGTGVLHLKSVTADGEKGVRDFPFTVKVPSSLAPKITNQTVSLNNEALPGWTVAVQGKSKLIFSANAAAQYGATVEKKEFRFGTKKASKHSGEILLEKAGTLTPTWSATDSRGLISTAEADAVKVYAYAPPALSNPTVYRSDKSGKEDDEGLYLTVRADATYSSVGGLNSAKLRVRYRTANGAWGSYTEWPIAQENILPGFDATKTYEVEVVAADALEQSAPALFSIPTEAVTFALREGGKGAAFGKYPQQAGLDMGWGIYMNGNPLTGLPAPASDTDATPWGQVNFDRIYPVGSLYLTVASTNPATLFGGTWERIKDTFLLAAGDTYKAGTTGGEADHKLTEEELPVVEGSATFRPWGSGNPMTETSGVFSRSTAGSTAIGFAASGSENDARELKLSFGGDQSHNNMPPYLAVNVWKRTA